MSTNNQYVVSISTTEDLGTLSATDTPYSTLNALGYFLQAMAGGSRFGTVDVQTSTGTTPVGASATVTFASVAAGNAVSVSGVKFVAVTGTPVRANNEFKRGVSDTADAADFVTTFNASSLSSVLKAAAAAGVVTITSQGVGVCQNAFTVSHAGVLASGTITLSSATGTLTATINGVGVTATAGASDTLSATALAAAINASTNALVKGFVTATSSAGVVTVRSLLSGLRGNTISLASSASGGSATASGARLTGGAVSQWEGAQASGTWTTASGSGVMGVALNGVAITVTWATSDTATAAAVAAAINSSTDALVQGLVYATSAAGVVTITAARGGVGGNAITLATSGAGTGQSVSGARLTAGAVPTQFVFAGSTVFATGVTDARLGAGVGLAGNGASNASGVTF